MKQLMFHLRVLAGAVALAQDVPRNPVEIESGSAAFEAVTNMPGVEVKGKSSTLTARVEVSREKDELILDRIVASLPVRSLATGMKVRDEHMRKYIFTTPDGQEPDLQFTAGKAVCASTGAAREFSCHIEGSLSLRGAARPLGINLKIKEQAGAARAFRASGDGIVKLSDYGIEPPSQFGVKPSNEVRIHLEMSGKEKPGATLSAGAVQ